MEANEKHRCEQDPSCDIEGKKRRTEMSARETLLEKKRQKAKSAGTNIGEYQLYYGPADREEIVETNRRFWYDGDEPYFVTFKDGKLISWTIDREMLNRRADKAEAEEVRAAQARRDAATAQALSHLLSSPTSCTSNKFGSTVYTECN